MSQPPVGHPNEELGRWLDGVMAFLTHYVVASYLELVACALWVIHTYVVQQLEVSPILVITSAEKRSGKSRLLDCLEFLVAHPFRCVIPSEAALFTILNEQPRRTLLIDEADAVFHPRNVERFQGMRAILDSGWRKGSPVPRVTFAGRSRQVEHFDVFGAKAVAAIGDLPDTIMDRAIVIRLKRRRADEPVARFRIRVAGKEAAALRDFGEVDVSLVTDVSLPDSLHDRAADCWEPMIAIADAAGHDWPVRAREAAVALSADIEENTITIGIRLLGDIKTIFDDLNADYLSSSDLLRKLNGLREAPWQHWYGHPLTAHSLATLLRPYGVAPAQRRDGSVRDRGYSRGRLMDAWGRYLPVTTETSEAPPSDAHPAGAEVGPDASDE